MILLNLSGHSDAGKSRLTWVVLAICFYLSIPPAIGQTLQEQVNGIVDTWAGNMIQNQKDMATRNLENLIKDNKNNVQNLNAIQTALQAALGAKFLSPMFQVRENTAIQLARYISGLDTEANVKEIDVLRNILGLGGLGSSGDPEVVARANAAAALLATVSFQNVRKTCLTKTKVMIEFEIPLQMNVILPEIIITIDGNVKATLRNVMADFSGSFRYSQVFEDLDSKQTHEIKIKAKAKSDGIQTVIDPPCACCGVCDVNADGQIDTNDIKMIFEARNTPASPDEPSEADGDGVITVNDARICTLLCTNPKCAP